MGNNRSGRKPKPTALRLLEGVPGHSRPINKNEPRPKRTRPALPGYLLDEQGAAIYHELADHVDGMGVVTVVDGTDLAIGAHALSQATKSEGRLQIAWLQLADRILGNFGLTPSARTKLTVPKDDDEADLLTRIQRRSS